MYQKITPLLALVLALMFGTAITPQITNAVEKSDGEESPEQVLDNTLAGIASQKKVIEDIDARVGKASGIMQVALESRLSKARMDLLEQNLSFAKAVAEQEKADTKKRKASPAGNRRAGFPTDPRKGIFQRHQATNCIPRGRFAGSRTGRPV